MEKDKKQVNIVNVYAPCDGRRKKELWVQLLEIIQANKDERICLMGDFNVIRDKTERRGVN